MTDTKHRACRWAFTLVLALSLGACLAACAPSSKAESDGAADQAADAQAQSVDNDTVVMGDLDRYDPATEQAAEEGASLAFDEESSMQQEKTAGFTGDAVTSQVEELPAGITGYSEQPPAGNDATTGEPGVVPHGDANGDNCLGCHSQGEQQVPQSHIDNGVENEDCTNCHQMM